jgi:hypothetical protein
MDNRAAAAFYAGRGFDRRYLLPGLEFEERGRRRT